MNQRERKKRTAKTESAVKTVEKAETVKVEQTKKAVVKAAKQKKFITHDSRRNGRAALAVHGTLWKQPHVRRIM